MSTDLTFAEQTIFKVAYYDFPKFLPPAKRFNPSIIKFQDRTFLFVRTQYSEMYRWNSYIEFYSVEDLSCTYLGCVTPLSGTLEDPRVFISDGTLFVSCISYVENKTTVHLIRFNGAAFEKILSVPGGRQDELRPFLPTEKNWVFFENKAVYWTDKKHIIYVFSSFKEDQIQKLDTFETTGISWDYGEIRGGTPPVKRNNLYWSFFHSCYTPKDEKTIYVMGAYAFETSAPHRIVYYTKKPILFGTHAEPHNDFSKKVVFPCGAYIENATWIVSFGSNDNFSCRIKIPHLQLKPHMKKLFAFTPEIIQSFKGWCSYEKACHMRKVIEDLQAKYCVEIGVFGGRSLIPQAVQLKAQNGVIIGIDAFSNDIAIEQDTSIHKDSWTIMPIAEAKAACEQAIKDYGLEKNCFLIQAPSNKIHSFLVPEIDVLHIDGSHVASKALEDVYNWVHKLRKGGVLYFDDLDWESTIPAQLLLNTILKKIDVVSNCGVYVKT